MKQMLCVALLVPAIAILALLALAEEEDPIVEYLAYYQQMGVSDSLLAQLETNMRQENKDSTWLAEHIEIQRKIMLEYRINKLEELAQTGTPEQKETAEAKIKELLDKEAGQ